MRLRLLLLSAAIVLAGCASAPKVEVPPTPATPAKPAPRASSKYSLANRPYMVFGREYVPATSLRAYRERGVASWYGRKFHGQKTSAGETYDMFAMTAAHPTLPLPSYARVTGVASGRSVIVRVNDRGPFLHDRVIDLSYAAAHRIGIAQKGSGEVVVEAILPGDPITAAVAPLPPVADAPVATAPPGVPASEPASPVPVASAEGGFVVQLGAFANNANAQNFVAHVANQLVPIGVEAKIRQAGGLFRVFVGPYPTRDEARRTGERLRNALGLESTIAAH
jgi:rare lipoprotein A